MDSTFTSSPVPRRRSASRARSGVARKFALATVLAAAASTAPLARAHIGYGGRDFGSFTGLSLSTVTIANQAVTGNFGWADAADGNLGDSHHARAFRFHLDTTASVTIGVQANATATATSVGGLIPAFSVYQGLAALAPFAVSQTALPSSADHDESAASEAWRDSWAEDNFGVGYDATATDGAWNALGSWRIGGDGDLPGDFTQLSRFVFKGFGVDFDLNGQASLTTTLGPGDYSVFIGGNDLANKTSDTAEAAFGLAATLTVNAVPEPTTGMLVLAGAAVLGLARRRATAR